MLVCGRLLKKNGFYIKKETSISDESSVSFVRINQQHYKQTAWDITYRSEVVGDLDTIDKPTP